MNLELLMGREAASPHLKPLSGLATLCAHVSPQALPPQRQDPVGIWPISMGVRLGRVLPESPASGLQAVVTPLRVLTQHLLHSYPNSVTSNNSLHPPRIVFDAEGLIGRPVGGRLKMSEQNVRSCRHKR